MKKNWYLALLPSLLIVVGAISLCGQSPAVALNANAVEVSAAPKLVLDDASAKRDAPDANHSISLSPLFSDGMVVQRRIPVPIWGTARAGQEISASLDDKNASAVADASGKWMLRLPAMEAGGPFTLRLQRGKPDAFEIENVYVGDVWLASGQSNMEYPLQSWSPPGTPTAQKAREAVMAANDPQLHFFTVVRASTDTPQTDLKGSWRTTTPENAGQFSAVAYYFARELRRNLKIPIGIIHASWGSSAAQGWTRHEVLASGPETQKFLDWWQGILAAYPQAKADYETQLAAWQVAVDQAKAAGTPAPVKPTEPIAPDFFTRPSALYNGMIAPLIPYGIKGVIWYQGESNAGNVGPRFYRKLFPALIGGWRQDWQEGDFPFLWVQLANYKQPQTQPVETDSWAEIREAQALTLSVPNTGMAVAIDLADPDNPNDIHPKDKWDVGKRLANVALSQVYGKRIAFSGPTYDSMTVEGSAIRLKFSHAEGLKAKGDALQGFAIAGADKNFVWADAKIEGDSVVVSSPLVAAPVAARYDWANNPIGNLYNGADLPASTFRTDS